MDPNEAMANNQPDNGSQGDHEDENKNEILEKARNIFNKDANKNDNDEERNKETSDSTQPNDAEREREDARQPEVIAEASGAEEEEPEEETASGSDEKPHKSFLTKMVEVFTGGPKKESKDAIQLIKDDHREVEGFFKEFEDAKNNDEKSNILQEILKALTVHTAFEESLVYSKLLDEDKDATQEAFVEHHVVKFLLYELSQTDMDDEQLEARVTVLKECVQHHVKEEESDLLPQLKAAGVDLQELGREIEDMKEKLMANYTSPPAVGAGVEQRVDSTSHPKRRTATRSKSRKSLSARETEKETKAKRTTSAKKRATSKPAAKASKTATKSKAKVRDASKARGAAKAKKAAAASKATRASKGKHASATKKTVAKKAAPKKATAKKSVSKKAAPKKAAANKTVAKKAAPKKATAKKAAPKKTVAKKSVAKKATPKKPAAKKTTSRPTTAKKAKSSARSAARPALKK